MIDKFISQFTDKKIDSVKKIGRSYYLVNEEILEALKLTDMTPDSAGLYLGEEKGEHFKPSLALLDMIAEISSRKVFVDEKSAWLFLCGRDIMAGAITKINVSTGLVLVQNGKDENLGFGKIVGNHNDRNQNAIVIKNILDKGDYLRREMD